MSIQPDALLKNTGVTRVTITPGTEIQATEPMHLSQINLKVVEQQRHHKDKLCFYCGSH